MRSLSIKAKDERSNEQRHVQTICLDFDGVCAKYNGKDIEKTGDPIEGLKEFIKDAEKNGYEIVIHSARNDEQIRKWQKEHDIKAKISFGKPPAGWYVDDRAVLFEGTFDGLLDKIKKFQPWWKKNTRLSIVNLNQLYSIVDDKGNFVLPKLPFKYNALEPVIDAETVKVHYTKHHQGYVDGANKAAEAIKKARRTGKLETIKDLSRDYSFNVNGHLLHSIYWTCLGKNNKRSDALNKLIEKSFGSFDKMKEQMNATATSIQGSGWGVISYSLITNELIITQIKNHENLNITGLIPLLVIDMWEHAFYLKYKNDKAKYVNKIWDIINWQSISDKLANYIS